MVASHKAKKRANKKGEKKEAQTNKKKRNYKIITKKTLILQKNLVPLYG